MATPPGWPRSVHSPTMVGLCTAGAPLVPGTRKPSLLATLAKSLLVFFRVQPALARMATWPVSRPGPARPSKRRFWPKTAKSLLAFFRVWAVRTLGVPSRGPGRYPSRTPWVHPGSRGSAPKTDGSEVVSPERAWPRPGHVL